MANTTTTGAADKGKGKAVEPVEDVSMAEESSSDEDIPEEAPEEEDNNDDSADPISTDNIISGGRRTRGKTIDFATANANAGDQPDDDDEDDEDFQAPEEDQDESMKE